MDAVAEWSEVLLLCWGRGGGLVDRAADSSPDDPSLIPLGEKKEIKRKKGQGWPIFFFKRCCFCERI